MWRNQTSLILLKSTLAIFIQIKTAYTLCPRIPLPGSIAQKHSHRGLRRGISDDCINQGRSDYAVVTSKLFPCNKIGLVFFHTTNPSQFGRPRATLDLLRLRVQSPILNIVSHCEEGKMNPGGFLTGTSMLQAKSDTCHICPHILVRIIQKNSI